MSGINRLIPPIRSSASMTQLPPSPEMKAMEAQALPDFSLDSPGPGMTSAVSSEIPKTSIRRLRSVARYQSFDPQVLACSDALTSYDQQPSQASPADSDIQSSLGAIAGPHGVALFHLSRPHVPLLILSHATNASKQKSTISSLAFEPKLASSKNSTNLLHLAAARGSGVLVWDASGHSPNPLIGRVGADRASNSSYFDDSSLTSICWKASATSTPLLATTSTSTFCLWDLRASSTAFKPSVSFGTMRSAIGPTPLSPFVRVACSSDSEECAAMDASGIVRIYDVRMTDRGRRGSPLSTFVAHATAGVGIAYFGSQSFNPGAENKSPLSRWLTWGLDVPLSSAITKVWMKSYGPQDPHSETNPSTDEYWDMAGDTQSTETPQRRSSKRQGVTTVDYIQTAQCVRPNLACARVCQTPVDNMFMTMGHLSTSIGGWWAELYTLSEAMEDSVTLGDPLSNSTFGVKKIAGFKGGKAMAETDRRMLMSVLGSSTNLGSLQAAELAITRDSSDSSELLLCCLSDSGVITTHIVPEALPQPERKPKHDRQMNSVRTAFPVSNQARVYPEDREGASLFDAANYWGGSKGPSESLQQHLDERRALFEPGVPSPTNVEKEVSFGSTIRRPGGETGTMPFDMDVPVAYGSVTTGNTANLQIGITDIATGNMVSTTATGDVLEEGDKVAVDSKKESIMDKIDTERVPCPRLCGAVFGRGNGGLVAFNNGEVKKMWTWYQRSDNARTSQIPIGKADALLSASHRLQISDDSMNLVATESSAHEVAQKDAVRAETMAKTGPRSLKELTNMLTAAKEAQWGDENESNESDDDDASAGDNFFEDESLGSSDDEEDGAHTPPPADELYQKYFGNRWCNSAETVQASSTDSDVLPRTTRAKRVLGPSSDTLNPVVFVSHVYDRESISEQSIALANGWELGPWTYDVATEIDIVSHPESIEPIETELFLSPIEPRVGQGLPHYQPVLSQSGLLTPDIFKSIAKPKDSSVPRTKSEGNLAVRFRALKSESAHVSSERSFGPKNNSPPRYSEGDDPSKRKESITFFKKLFVHQQHGGMSPGYSNWISPPDSPSRNSEEGMIVFQPLARNARTMSVEYLGARDPRVTSTALELPKIAPVDPVVPVPASPRLKHGVYTLCVPNDPGDKKFSSRERYNEQLESIRKRCLHNAAVCAEQKETEKEGVWNLLAQTIEGQMDQWEKQTFNGWGGKSGGALGVGLVRNLLKYYEARRDSQMLATLVCVLSGGRRRPPAMDSDSLPLQDDRPFLLPEDPSGKYDLYIRRYAELLYSWGLLTRRAEVNKHLVRNPIAQDTAFVRLSKNRSQVNKSRASYHADPAPTLPWNKSPGIGWNITCPQCGEDTDFNTNFCRKCRDFAFRCSLCNNAVRGLFTVCELCRHGGHVNHMSMWFSNHDECPTGCGCHCTLASRFRKDDPQSIPVPVNSAADEVF